MVRKPAIDAVAGFVPWLLSGTRTSSRWPSPRSRWYARIIRIPVSSPWAPAAGCRVTARMPEISARAASSSQSNWSVPCATSSGASGWSDGEAGQPGGPLVELGIELHRARAQRVEAGVDREVQLREVDVVADDLGLVELGQPRGIDPTGLGRDPGEGVLGRMRDLAAAATRAAALEQRGLQLRARDAHRGPLAVATSR